MGVKDLWTILAPVKRHRPIASLKGQTFAVDLSMWVCESVTVKPMQGRVVKPHLRNLFFRVSNLLHLGINLIFVIDGEAPELKWEEMSRRTQARYGANGKGKKAPAPKHKKGGRSNFKVWLRECQEMLLYLGIPCVQSKGEAEAMCALLNSQGIADACLTEDGDAFLYGAHTVYRNFTLNTKDPHVDCFSMSDIKRELGLDREKLVALALLLGCDYLPKGVVGVGKEQGCQLMKHLDGVNVLERFQKWANGDIGADCLTQTSKPSHCKVCNHVGTGKQHKTRGCVMCGTSTACFEQRLQDSPCYCAWHRVQNDTETTQVERDVMRKAMKTAGFPFKPVVSEYLDQCDRCPSSSLQWDRPQLQPIQKFNLLKLEWPEDYTLDKVFPLLSLYDLTNAIPGKSKEKHLVMDSFVKTRTRQGVSCIEVKWERPDWDGEDTSAQFYNTIERGDLLAAAYPEKYRVFMEEKETKKCGKSKGKEKQKADPDADADLIGSQPPSSSATPSSTTDDMSLDDLVSGVMSLDISKSEVIDKKDSKPDDTSQTTDTGSSSVKDDRKEWEELPLSQRINIGSLRKSQYSDKHDRRKSEVLRMEKKDTTSCAKIRVKKKQTHRSQHSVKYDKSKSMKSEAIQVQKKEHMLCVKTQVAEKSQSKQASRDNKRQSESANTSDLDFLDELLEYEASQSLTNKSKEMDTLWLQNSGEKITKEDDDVESEILPLFQRIRLKSAKGTARRGKGISNIHAFEQEKPATDSKLNVEKSGGRNEQRENEATNLGLNLPPTCKREVIVIDSDDEDEVIKTGSLTKGTPIEEDYKLVPELCDVDVKVVHNSSSNDNSVKKDSLSVNLPQKVCLNNVNISPHPATTLSEILSSSDGDDDEEEEEEFTATSGDYPTAVFADNTAVADYKLTQPKVADEVAQKRDIQAEVNEEQRVERMEQCDTTAPATTLDSTSPQAPNSTQIANQSHNVTIGTPSCNHDITASSISSSFCYNDSQMSLFDSPSISLCNEPSSRFSATANNPMSTKHTGSVEPNSGLFDSPASCISPIAESSSRLSATAYNPMNTKHTGSVVPINDKFSKDSAAGNVVRSNNPSPCVIDLNTPDMMESTSVRSENLNHKRLFKAEHNSESRPTQKCEAVQLHTAVDSMLVSTSTTCTISPYARDIETPDIPVDFQITEDQNAKSVCKLSVHDTADNGKSKSSKQEDVLTNFTDSMLPQEHVPKVLDNKPSPCSTSHGFTDHNNMTFVPVPVNCDTPQLSLLPTPSSSSLSNNTKAKEDALVDHVTPRSRKYQHRPHTLVDQLSQNTPVTESKILQNVSMDNKDIDSISHDIGAIMEAGPSTPSSGGAGTSDNQDLVVERIQMLLYEEEIENSPVSLLDRLRKKFDQCGDKKATLTAMTQRSKPRL